MEFFFKDFLTKKIIFIVFFFIEVSLDSMKNFLKIRFVFFFKKL